MMLNGKQIKGLTEFQKNKIKKRMSLDFYSELNNKTEAKFNDQGILFYSINIELPFLSEEKNIWKRFYTEV
jgi:hypothetical protein